MTKDKPKTRNYTAQMYRPVGEIHPPPGSILAPGQLSLSHWIFIVACRRRRRRRNSESYFQHRAQHHVVVVAENWNSQYLMGKASGF